MGIIESLTGSKVFATGTTLADNILSFISYLIGLFIKNPLYFLGGLVLLRASQKGVKFNLKDLFKFDLD